MKKIINLFFVFIILFSYIPIIYAQFSPTIIINEIAWSGSVTSGSDEWIELYNATTEDISLLGYRIEDDGNEIIIFDDITVLSGNYFLIEKKEEATTVQSDLIISNISFANSGDSIVLFDDGGQIIDQVNSTGGTWFAGSSSSRGTMSRVDSDVSGDIASNWVTSTQESNITDSEGEKIIGSPGYENIISDTNISSDNKVYFEMPSYPRKGDNIEVNVVYEGQNGIFGYGVDVEFDNNKLQYKGGSKTNFLSDQGDVETSFQIGLQKDNSSHLVVSEVRLESQNSVTALSSGTLFILEFEVLASANSFISLDVLNSSFVSDLNGDISIDFQDFTFTVGEKPIDTLQNFSIQLGDNRYSLRLEWDLDNSIDTYYVQKKDWQGVYQDIGNTTSAFFIDNQDVIPEVSYSYRIQVMIDNTKNTVQEIVSQDSRGIRGDFNRDDRIDGRDLESLAKIWKSNSQDSDFNSLIDVNVDGKIDSLDLFIMSGNWGRVY